MQAQGEFFGDGVGVARFGIWIAVADDDDRDVVGGDILAGLEQGQGRVAGVRFLESELEDV